MDNKPEECKACLEIYDEAQRRPRSLSCGHTFCSQCIEDAIKNVIICPICHAEHRATAITQFPINNEIEALIRNFKGAHLTPAEALSAKPHQDRTKGISKKLWIMVQEEKSSISNLLSDCEEALSQLGKYQEQVRDWKTQHYQLQDRLYDLVEQNKAAIELLEQEDTSIVNMTSEGETGRKQLQTVLERLDTITTAQEVVTTVDVADQFNVETEDWIQKCQELFPNVNTVSTSVKMQDTITKALDMMTSEISDTAANVHLGDFDCTIMEKVKRITNERFLGKLTVDHLRGMNESIKKQVEAGLVLAVHKDQDDLHYSRITFQDGRLYLHTLQHQPPPNHAHILQMMEVMGALEPSSTLVFLDLAWPGSPRGRLHIRLNADTSLTRQFVLLCTGQRGSSYLNTKLFKLFNKSEPGECVRGGDYQYNDGEGGAPLLPHQHDHQYQESGSAGAVWSPWPRSNKSAQFGITTRDRSDGGQWPFVFGEVVSGLYVVSAAVNHSNITEVTVVDCGVVLTF